MNENRESILKIAITFSEPVHIRNVIENFLKEKLNEKIDYRVVENINSLKDEHKNELRVLTEKNIRDLEEIKENNRIEIEKNKI